MVCSGRQYQLLQPAEAAQAIAQAEANFNEAWFSGSKTVFKVLTSPAATRAAGSTGNAEIVASALNNVGGNLISNPIADALGVPAKYGGPWSPAVSLGGKTFVGASAALRVVSVNAAIAEAGWQAARVGAGVAAFKIGIQSCN